MIVKVSLIPPNKDYIFIRTQDGQEQKFPRKFARHVSANDICLLTEYRNRPRLKILTDEDKLAMINGKQLIKVPPQFILTP